MIRAALDPGRPSSFITTFSMQAKNDSPARLAKMELAAIAAIVAVGVLLRLYGLGAKSLWLDEVVLARSAYGDGTLTSSLGFGAVVHPPGYLILMRLLEQYVGQSDWLVRLPAALFSMAGIVAIWALGRSLAGRSVGLAAAFLLAISAFHIQYGQELHTYALFGATSTLLLWSLLRAVRRLVGQPEEDVNLQAGARQGEARRPTSGIRRWLRAWWPFGLIALVALYSHYYAVFTVAMTVLMLPIFLLMESGQPVDALWRDKKQRAALLGYVATMAVVGVLSLPQVIFGLRNSMDYASLRVESVAAGELVKRFEIGPHLAVDTFVSFSTARGAATGESILLLALLAIFFLLGFAWMLAQPAGPARRRYRLLALAAIVWIALPLPVIAILAQRAGESFAARRLIFILPMVVVVEAMGVVGVANWIGRLLSPTAPATNNARSRIAWLVMAALLAVVAVASIGTLRSYYSRPKQDYRTAAELVRSQAEPEDIVVALGSMTRNNLAWYFPGSISLLAKDVEKTLSAFCADNDAVFFVAVPPASNYPENSAAWIGENFVEVPLYQISVYYRNCQPDAWYGAGAEALFEQALAQPIIFPGTAKAFDQFRKLAEQGDLPDIRPTLLTELGQNPQEPNNRAARMSLAATLVASGQTAEGLAEYEAINRQWPDFPYAWVKVGDLLEKAGEADQALAAYETAVEADPQDVNLRFILAYAYRHLGTPEQAIAAFEAALSMDPSREAARKVLEELKAAQSQ